MLGIPTLAVGISCQRNCGSSKEKILEPCFSQKRQLFLHLSPRGWETRLAKNCGEDFWNQRSNGFGWNSCTMHMHNAQTNNCRKDFQMVLGEIVAKTRLFQIISKGWGCTFKEAHLRHIWRSILKAHSKKHVFSTFKEMFEEAQCTVVNAQWAMCNRKCAMGMGNTKWAMGNGQ